MTFSENSEPPSQVVYLLEEALDLLGSLEDAREALIQTDHLAEVSLMEQQLQLLNRRLGFDGIGGSDG